MNYLVKIPLADLENASNNLDIAFEYYGTVTVKETLSRLGVGEVFYVDQDTMDNHNSNHYYDETVRILPAAGCTNNAENGDTAEGEWWVTNTGDEETPSYTLYLNNANITTSNPKYSSEEYIDAYGSLTIELVDGTTNNLGAEDSENVRWALDAISALHFVIQGNGTLNVYGTQTSINCYGSTIIRDGAIINAYVDCTDNGTGIRGMGLTDFTIDNASVKTVAKNVSYYNFALSSPSGITLVNDARLEVYAYGGDDNYGIDIRDIETIDYDKSYTTLMEGDSADEAVEVNAFEKMNEQGNYFYTKPYILIVQDMPEDIESINLEVVNIPKGGQTTEEIGNAIEISGDCEEVTYTTYCYAEDIDKARSGEWFEGTFEEGATIIGVIKIEPTEGYRISGDTDINIEGASVVGFDNIIDDDNELTGNYMLYLAVVVEEGEEDIPEDIESINLEVVNIPKGGQTTEEIGNAIEVSGDCEEITYTPYYYAEDIDKARSGEWFEGTFEEGATIIGVIKIEPTEGYRISGDTDINIEGASVVGFDNILDDEEILTGNYMLYLAVVVEEGEEEPEEEEETIIRVISFNANGGTGTMEDVEISGDTYELPACGFKAPSGKTFSTWDAGKVGATISVSGDMVITAQWKNKPTSSGGSSSSDNVTTKANNGKIITKKVEGQSKAREYIFTPNEGYEISDVLLDGVSIGKVNSYVIEDITKKHKLEFFAEKIKSETNDDKKEEEKMPWSKVDNWAEPEMKLAKEYGLIPETFENKDFTKAITREEFAAVAVKLYEFLSGQKATTIGSNPFIDTNDAYVLKAYSHGITKGTSATTFEPNTSITREQMATMLARAVEAAGIKTNAESNSIKFADDNLMHEWGRNSIYFMAGKEIIKGVGDNKYDPLGNAKVEEALAISLRCSQTFKAK